MARLGYHLLWNAAEKSDRRELEGIPVRVFCIDWWEVSESLDYLHRVGESLGLLATAAPRWLQRARESLEGILVSDVVLGARGRFVIDNRLCVLHPRYVFGGNTNSEDLACTIVHEAAHAWIHRRGISHSRHLLRIERICHEVSFATAKKLGMRGEAFRAESRYLADVPGIHSERAQLEFWLEAVEASRAPGWSKTVRFGWTRRRARKRLVKLRSDPGADQVTGSHSNRRFLLRR